jgi:alpha-tubulin suppressor-like RCC1 family protein
MTSLRRLVTVGLALALAASFSSCRSSAPAADDPSTDAWPATSIAEAPVGAPPGTDPSAPEPVDLGPSVHTTSVRPDSTLFVPNLAKWSGGSRLADTRQTGAPAFAMTSDRQVLAVGPVAAGQTLRIPVTGRGGVPDSGVEVVALAVVATGATATTSLTVHPTGEPPPKTWDLTLGEGQTAQNLVFAEIGNDGSVSVTNADGSTHVIVDAVGWFPTAGGYTPLAARLADTRPEGQSLDGNARTVGPVTAGAALRVPVAGRAGIPHSGVGSVAVALTATNATAPTTVTVRPDGEPRPTAHGLTIAPGRAVTNTIITQPGADGTITIESAEGSVDVVVDIAGWFPPTDGYTPLTPARLADTRPRGTTVDGSSGGGGPIPQGGRLGIPVEGRAGLPTTQVGAVVLTVTVPDPTADSRLVVSPAGREGSQPPHWFSAGPTVTRTVISEVGGDGTISIDAWQDEVDVIIDVVGWFPEPPALRPITAVATGDFHSCALLADGTARCWGRNDDGQLGNGTTTDSSTPVTVTGLTDAVAMTAWRGHSCALLADGTARCWGRNDSGQLGNGTTTDSSTPVTDAVAISTAGDHTCALLADHTVACWGRNDSGQLGNGTTTDSSTPVTVTGLTDVTAIAAGTTTCALLAVRSVRCWGRLPGSGTGVFSSATVPIDGLGNVAAISSGDTHTCALLADHTAVCWGENRSGQLGNGSDTASSVPVAVHLAGIATITVGSSHTCALLTDGDARCWGRNDFGQLGNGTTIPTDTHRPLVALPTPVIGLHGATAVAPAVRHTCALLGDGTARCWGGISDGELGNRDLGSTLPVTVLSGSALLTID